MAFTYAIVDSFSIAFLLILFISTREKFSLLTETRCFRLIVILTAAALLGDLAAWQLDGQSGEAARFLLWAVNIMCYILSGATSLSWLYFTGLKMDRLRHLSKKVWAVICLPFIFLAVVALLTPRTHWLFYIDDANVYQRGSLFIIQVIIPFAYLLSAAVWSLIMAGRERLRQQRIEYINLSSFIVFPLIGGVLQFLIYGVSLAWPCTALSLMLVYLSLQNQKISLDTLTGLNNRGQFDKHLYNCFERSDSFLSFALFMLDIDNFKKINDEYGHIAGDAALIDAAGILKRSLAKANAFLARYGGDEFAIVLYFSAQDEIDKLLERITEESEILNSNNAAQYKLVFSVGYVCYDKHRYANYQDMINAADAHMYIQKRAHKAAKH